MKRRTFLSLIPAGLLVMLKPIHSETQEEVKLLFPVSFNDRKRFKKVFLRIRGAINIWGANADIEVIAYDEGIVFLDRFENGEFEERINNLMLYGVKFRACKVAMGMFEVPREALFDGVDVVRSGFEYHVLKIKEGYIPIYI